MPIQKKLRYKKVAQYDSNGNLVKVYDSVAYAARTLNVDSRGIRRCCNGTQRVSGGFYWMYVTDNIVDVITLPYVNSLYRRSVVQLNSVEEIIAEYSSIKEAAQVTRISPATISNCLSGRRFTGRGFLWRYKRDSVNGLNAEMKLAKPRKYRREIFQCADDGTVVNVYNSLVEASKQTGISINSLSYCVRGSNRMSGGYVWKRKEES